MLAQQVDKSCKKGKYQSAAILTSSPGHWRSAARTWPINQLN